MTVNISVNDDVMVINRDGVIHNYKMEKGFQYLAELLINAQENIPFTFLNDKLASVDKYLNKRSDEEVLRSGDYIWDDMQFAALRLEMIDGKTIASCRNEQRRLEEALSDAERNNDIGLMDQINKEIGDIQEYLFKAYNPYTRKVRRFKNEFDKYIHSVYMAFYRAFGKIERNDPDLAWALRKSVNIAFVCSYEPLIGLRIEINDKRRPPEKAECMELIRREEMSAQKLAIKPGDDNLRIVV